jgi:hypothetical protein
MKRQTTMVHEPPVPADEQGQENMVHEPPAPAKEQGQENGGQGALGPLRVQGGALAGTGAAPRPFDPACLVRVGQGFWTYRHRGDPKDTQRPGYFADAFRRYGMRDGDVICVNAAPFGVGLLSAAEK